LSSLNVSNGVEAIQELKAAILAIEWEITDEALDTLLGSLGPLQEKWAGQKAFLVCLQIIGTLGGYIKSAREKAHPDATKLLHSVFNTLDLVVTDDTLSASEKTEKVRVEVAKYNELKKEIATKPAAPAKEAEEVAAPPEESAVPSETIKNLMEDKEKTAEEPFNELYQEMVKDEQKPAAPSPAAAMPSTQQPVGADEKEVSLDRIDDEIFPEADQLIDDFFSEGDELELSPAAVEEPVAEEVVEDAAEEAEEAEEIVEFTLTKVTEEEDAAKEAAADEEFRSKIEAEIAERLDFGDEEQEAKVKLEIETDVQEIPEPVIPQTVSSDLDVIIDSFASKLAEALTAEIKKKVQEEMEQLRSELSNKKDDAAE
jgi:hypothetical protein